MHHPGSNSHQAFPEAHLFLSIPFSLNPAVNIHRRVFLSFLKESPMYILHFDGLYRSAFDDDSLQAGLMCYAWLIFHNNTMVARGHGGFARSHHATSNGAEYLALIDGLEALLDLGLQGERIRIFGDAKTVIQQMQGLVGVNSPGIRPLHKRAAGLAARFTRLKWTWTPRSENKAADQLSRHALRCIHADAEQYQAALQAVQSGHPRAARFIPLADLRIYLSRTHPR
jgi:ribonuclease HI